MNTPTIGAYFQCFKQPKSTIATISSFRKNYPNGTIVVASDGGYDYSDISHYYGCTYVQYDRMGTDIGIVTTDRNKIITWVNRLLDAAKIIPDDYIMILEDDVRIYKPVESLRYDCNGINTEVRIGSRLTEFLKTRNSTIPKDCTNYYFGGCGGAIINKQFILDNIKDIDETITILESYQDEKMRGQYVSDYWISILILYHGGSLGPYEGFSETWHMSYSLKQHVLHTVKTAHFDKTLHNKPLSKNELAILGRAFDNDASDYAARTTTITPFNIQHPMISMLRSRFFRLIKRYYKKLCQ